MSSSQADAMLRRVSPEGRARAEKERERRHRAASRLVGRCALAALAIVLVAMAIDATVMPIGVAGILLAMLAFVISCVAIAVASRERPVPLAQSSLRTLPDETERWLERQRPALPDGSASLLDSISLGLGEMGPQLAMLDPTASSADAVRRLLATDLPALVSGYRQVPASLRTRPGNEGPGNERRDADAHLLHGLSVIDGEIDRMNEQLARGAFDELATQHRFLELKYDGGDSLA